MVNKNMSREHRHNMSCTLHPSANSTFLAAVRPYLIR